MKQPKHQLSQKPEFKLSFIPKLWEINPERQYLQLYEDWGLRLDPYEEFTLEDVTKVALTKSNFNDYAQFIGTKVPVSLYELSPVMGGYDGPIWYVKKFDLPLSFLHKKLLLHFWGVNYRAKIWLNGELVGEHEGAWLPFSVNISDAVKDTNLLIVRTDSRLCRDHDMILSDNYNHAGIHREVFIEAINASYIEDIAVKSKPTENFKKASAVVTASLAGEAFKGNLRFFIYEVEDLETNLLTTARKAVNSTKQISVQIELPNPKLWSPDAPSLYFVKLILEDEGKIVDGAGSTFGIRAFEIKKNKFFLNGQPIFLRGITKHDEICFGDFPRGGRVMSEKQRINEFRMIHKMNANAVRLAQYPNHPYNLDICDRLGLIVLQGWSTNYCTPTAAEKEELSQKFLKVGEEAIERDKHHPSLIMWEVADEFIQENHAEFIARASKLAHQLDDRPTYFTGVWRYSHPNCYDHVDVVCRNEYIGWYDISNPNPLPSELESHIKRGVREELEKYHQYYPNKPIVVTETGAEAKFGLRHQGDRLIRGTEEYQAHYLRFQIEEILRHHDYVAGIFPWCFADFMTRLESQTCQIIPHLNLKGVVSFNRQEKLGYYELQGIYEKIREGRLSEIV